MLVVVDTRELKEMFNDIKPILKPIGEGALLGVSLSKQVLRFTARNGLVYTKSFYVEGDGPYNVTVLYQDISEMLPSSGVATLDLEPVFVGIKTQQLSTTLRLANGIVSEYNTDLTEFRPCDAALYKRISDNFALLSPVAKSLGQETSAIMAPPYAVLKYSTVWLQTPFEGFDSLLSLRDLKAIAAFNPSELAISETAIEFKRRSAFLAVPKSPTQKTTTVIDILKNPSKPINLFPSNPLADVQKFTRSVGAGACKLLFYADGYEVKVDNSRYQCQFAHGDCTKLLYTLPTYLEYLPMLFRIFPMKSAQLVIGTNAVAVSEEKTTLLHSVV